MKKKVSIASIGILLIAIVIMATGKHDPLLSKKRRAWKNEAIKEIALRSRDVNWLNTQKAELGRRNSENPNHSDGWLSEQLILMQNGDWLVYKNVCWKEKSNIADLFLAKGSDGKWYYSTFHFCVQMITLKSDAQPEGLSEFVKSYFLEEFDGDSDDCLKTTWPPTSR
jgi:hypothetical protein